MKVDITNVNFKKIEKLYRSLEPYKKELGLELIEEAKFLKETLDRLKQSIRENDVIDDMSQGEYSIKRSDPAIKTYNTTIKNYTSIIKQMYDLIPEKKTEQPVDDGFEDF